VGPGASAGVVLFDRERPDFSTGNVHLRASLLGASAGRNDQNADLEAGSERMYVRVTANHSHSQDYKDGQGRRVPSAWDKWNADAAVGLTPDADTRLELSAGAGDGWARYGGRGMDGTQFRRDSLGLRFEKEHLTPWLAKIDAQLYRNQADHVMDNFTLRTPPATGMMAGGMASNVQRTTTGGAWPPPWCRAMACRWSRAWTFAQPARGAPRHTRDALRRSALEGRRQVRQPGRVCRASWQAQPGTRWVGGLRLDRAQAWRYPASNPGMGGMGGAGMGMPASADDNHRARSALPSGFVRWERTLQPGTTAYVGLGHVQRFPDYWELISPATARRPAAMPLPRCGRRKPRSSTRGSTGRGRTGSSGARATWAGCRTTSCSTTPAWAPACAT
jgi:iron complex outermembrane receptor protein